MIACFYKQLRRPRFSIAELMISVVAIAIALVWPVILLLTCVAIFSMVLLRAGLNPLIVIIFISFIGFVLGMLSGYGFFQGDANVNFDR